MRWLNQPAALCKQLQRGFATTQRTLQQPTTQQATRGINQQGVGTQNLMQINVAFLPSTQRACSLGAGLKAIALRRLEALMYAQPAAAIA